MSNNTFINEYVLEELYRMKHMGLLVDIKLTGSYIMTGFETNKLKNNLMANL